MDHRLRWMGAGRVPIVFVSASAEDAHTFREIADPRRSLVVNVPDLAGARAVIGKLSPGLVVCDTGIEGAGTWRDLLEEYGVTGFALAVTSRHAGKALWTEVLSLGGSGVIEKPFRVEEVERIIALAFPRQREELGAAAHEPRA